MEDVIIAPETPEIVEAPIVEQAVTTENAEPNVEVVETKPEKTFTQAELNEIITKRLDRERETISKKVAQEARDAYFAEQKYVTHDGKPITTEAEYKQALKEQELINQYRERDLPEEVIQELVEGKKFRERLTEAEKKTQEVEHQKQEFARFMESFPGIKGEDVPPSVWAEVDKGSSLVDAYTRYENKTLKEQLAAVAQAKQIEQQNMDNAASSTGSVTGLGSVEASFISLDTFEKNRNDAGWVKKNFDKIMESRAKW